MESSRESSNDSVVSGDHAVEVEKLPIPDVVPEPHIGTREPDNRRTGFRQTPAEDSSHLRRFQEALCAHFVAPDIRQEQVLDNLDFLQRSVPVSALEFEDDPAPVFLLSAGWRSGSTLLQRLICSDENVLVWGEPFGDRIPICRLAAMIDGLQDGDPHWKYTLDRCKGDLAQQWVANLNPGLDSLWEAHRAFCDTLLKQPAQRWGAGRWGAKWVRLTAQHAGYLRWLYPSARIVFLVRHPLHAYLSYKGKRWYTSRPRFRVCGPMRFFAHWAYLASSFLREAAQLDALLLRYEDLCDQADALSALRTYTNAEIRQEILQKRIGARDGNNSRTYPWETVACRLLCEPACRELSYNMDGSVGPWRYGN